MVEGAGEGREEGVGCEECAEGVVSVWDMAGGKGGGGGERGRGGGEVDEEDHCGGGEFWGVGGVLEGGQRGGV